MRRTIPPLVLSAAALFAACSGDDDSPPGPPTSSSGRGGAGGSGALCGEVPKCTSDGDGVCPPDIFSSCRGGQCCADYTGCIECGCDEHCPAERPWCTLGVCGECASTANCPKERPCCEKVPFPVPVEGGRYTCIPIDGVRCRAR